MTEVMLMVKCCAKNKTRNKPERAIATFRAIEEDSIPIVVLFQKEFHKNTLPKIDCQRNTIIHSLFRFVITKKPFTVREWFFSLF